MSNIYNHRQIIPTAQGGSNRLNELFEALKSEYENLQQEAVSYKLQRDDFEHKVQQQMEEVNVIRQGLYELQATHQQIKQKYDSEIMRLNRDLEQQRLHPHQSTSGAHPQAPSHPPPQPPNIGQGQSNLFGGIMSGAGQTGLVAPPQMSLDPSQQQQPPPTSHPGYPGPSGPPPNVPQVGSSSAQPPYLNNGVPPNSLSQAQHTSKRPRIDESNGPQPLLNINSQPSSQNQNPLYPSNGLPQPAPNQPGQQGGSSGSGYIPSVGPSSKPGSKMSKVSQNLGPEGPQPSSAPQNGGPPSVNKRKANPNSNSSSVQGSRPTQIKQSSVSATSGLGDMDPESISPAFKKEGQDWFAIFNPKVHRLLDVDLVHTLDHNSVVCCVKFSADGRFLATGCNRSAQIYDVQTGAKMSVLADDNVDKTGDLYIRSVCFSPDGKYLATGAEDKQIRIWDIATQKIRNMFQGHEQDIYSLDFSRDGRLIVSGSGDKTARVWDMLSGEELFKLTIEEASQKDAGVTSVAISPDGQYVAAGSLDKIVRVWDARSGYQLERLEGHKDSVYSVAFSPDGKTLVSGSLDKTLRLWDMSHPGRNGGASNSKSHKLTFNGHKDFVLSVAVSPDGRWVVSGSKDRGVQFWDPNTAQTQFMLQGHKNSVISVALSPVGKLFATGSEENPGESVVRIITPKNLERIRLTPAKQKFVFQGTRTRILEWMLENEDIIVEYDPTDGMLTPPISPQANEFNKENHRGSDASHTSASNTPLLSDDIVFYRPLHFAKNHFPWLDVTLEIRPTDPLQDSKYDPVKRLILQSGLSLYEISKALEKNWRNLMPHCCPLFQRPPPSLELSGDAVDDSNNPLLDWLAHHKSSTFPTPPLINKWQRSKSIIPPGVLTPYNIEEVMAEQWFNVSKKFEEVFTDEKMNREFGEGKGGNKDLNWNWGYKYECERGRGMILLPGEAICESDAYLKGQLLVEDILW
ncbi:6172_t:CDS:10 [Ambispora leptoticha]|uniref:6172_t:CDS:1 n=1 Tax=Ambispora leptoticha TaxID=144679 RepID=A0A9N8VA05_9GLOM|nr:6172_t:CDS:10 [Ambispora leptoticha]